MNEKEKKEKLEKAKKIFKDMADAVKKRGRHQQKVDKEKMKELRDKLVQGIKKLKEKKAAEDK